MLRYGSAWHDVASQVSAITERGLDSRHFILCTDDSHAQTLVDEGHMDRVLRHAIEHGLEPMTAIQMATINAAEHFKLSRDIGQIAPGRYADILLVSDLNHFDAELVIAKGVVIAKDGGILADFPGYQYPDWVTASVNLGRVLTKEDFRLMIDLDKPDLSANVIGVIENQAPTEHLVMEIHPAGGEIPVDLARDIAKIAIVERHRGTGIVQVGLVHGFGFSEKCGIATTVAHDSHNMIVVGTDEGMMAQAANQLRECGGGQIVVKDSQVIGQVELPIAGLMSSEHAESVAEKAGSVLKGFQTCGCLLNNPNMQLSLLALVVIPELRISDLGLVDVNNFKTIPVVVRND